MLKSVTDSIINVYQKEWDRRIRLKLGMLRMKAFQEGPFEVYECMRGFNFENDNDILAMKEQLEAKGYELEIQDQIFKPEFKNTGLGEIQVDMDFSNLKVRIKKTVMEV